jgi:hypothetical protein
MSPARPTHRVRTAAFAALALGLLAGCGGASSAAEPAAPAQEAHVDLEPAPVPTPDRTAGPLSERQLPRGEDLGEDWTAYAHPGGGESGVIANGSSAQRREVGGVMDGLRPIGCPERAVAITLPRPAHALEGSYRGPRDAPGVSLVLQFGDRATAERFLTRLGRQVDACPDVPVDDPDVPRLAYERLPMSGDRVAALRRAAGYDADPNPYLLVAVRSGDRVALVYLANAKPADRTKVAAGLAAAAAR